MRTNLLKTQTFLASILFIATAFCGLAQAGTGDGGGGDAIRCDDGKLYSWDYIQTQSPDMPTNPELEKFFSGRDILMYISTNLKTKIPRLATDLEDFAKLNRNPMNTKSKRLWHSSSNPLHDLSDEAKRRIPADCIRDRSRPIRLLQAVVRIKTNIITYHSDLEVQMGLAATSPVQLSYLYVHEWLRDYTQDPYVIMDVNNLLHTNLWLSASGEVLRTALRNYGLKINFETLTEQKKRLADEAKAEQEHQEYLAREAARLQPYLDRIEVLKKQVDDIKIDWKLCSDSNVVALEKQYIQKRRALDEIIREYAILKALANELAQRDQFYADKAHYERERSMLGSANVTCLLSKD